MAAHNGLGSPGAVRLAGRALGPRLWQPRSFAVPKFPGWLLSRVGDSILPILWSGQVTSLPSPGVAGTS